jgi:hypothetical protein
MKPIELRPPLTPDELQQLEGMRPVKLSELRAQLRKIIGVFLDAFIEKVRPDMQARAAELGIFNEEDLFEKL